MSAVRAAYSVCSPPPCGEGLGVGGVVETEVLPFLPPSLTLPRKGGGNAPAQMAMEVHQ
jgi:hypothetical protein